MNRLGRLEAGLYALRGVMVGVLFAGVVIMFGSESQELCRTLVNGASLSGAGTGLLAFIWDASRGSSTGVP